MSAHWQTWEKESAKMIFNNHLALCKGCGLCIAICPKKCLKYHQKNQGIYGQPAIDIDIDKCIQCRQCENICPDVAITIEVKDLKK